jgi:hypothetical protein
VKKFGEKATASCPNVEPPLLNRDREKLLLGAGNIELDQNVSVSVPRVERKRTQKQVVAEAVKCQKCL